MTKQVVIAITGGGSEVIGNLLKFGGASSWFMEGIVPYHKNSLDEFLGFTPDKYASLETAKQMAIKSFSRALKLGAIPEKAVGIGCSASLAQAAGINEREGRKHVVYIAAQVGFDTLILSSFQLLEKRYREFEERMTAEIIANLVHSLNKKTPNNWRTAGFSKEEIKLAEIEVFNDRYFVGDIIFNNKSPQYRVVNGDFFLKDSSPIVFPGSFNPIHQGHIDIIKYMYKKNGGKKIFPEISVINVDKPKVGLDDINKRIDAILDLELEAIGGILVSNVPTFLEKANLYPKSRHWNEKGTHFIVGGDTYNRLFDRKYSNVSEMIEKFKSNENTISVFAREGFDLLSNTYPDIFRMENLKTPNISSSEIRKNENNHSG